MELCALGTLSEEPRWGRNVGMDGFRRRIRGTSENFAGSDVGNGVDGWTMPLGRRESGARGLRGGEGRISGREEDIFVCGWVFCFFGLIGCFQ